MTIVPSYRALALGGLVLGLAACSDSGPLAPSDARGPSLVGALLVPTPAEVVVAGTTAGSFSAFTADNSGRATTEFWDNPSADNTVATDECNVGFFADGTMGPGCTHQTAATDANMGGYSEYWGDGAGGNDPSAFMFNGDFDYDVTLIATFAGEESEVGWFTKEGGVYTFHPVAAWGDKTIDAAISISTGGADWGFYISNGYQNDAGCGTETSCSDAEGGYTADPEQKFVLMTNGGGTSYLVGVEDQPLELLVDGPFDSDYNDYIFEVVAEEEAESLEGRMTGGVSKLVSDAGDTDVSISFTVHCDITLSNNIQINWGSGHKWHIDKPISTAFCSLEEDPTPPVAPINIFEGTAVGRYNGVDGYPIEFTFVDRGERRGAIDAAGFTIYEQDGTTVLLQVDLQDAVNGNIQAHFDQPHGQKP